MSDKMLKKTKLDAKSKTVAVDSTPTIKIYFKNAPSNSNVCLEKRASNNDGVYVQALKDRLKSKSFCQCSSIFKEMSLLSPDVAYVSDMLFSYSHRIVPVS